MVCSFSKSQSTIMAACSEESSKDTSQIMSTDSVKDATETEKGDSITDNAKIVKDSNNQVAGTQGAIMNDENVETFQDEPQGDADLHRKRHFLRRKEARVESVQGENGAAPATRNVTDGGGAPTTDTPTVMVNGQQGAKARPKLKILKPSSPKKPRAKLKLPKPSSNRGKLSTTATSVSRESSDDEGTTYGKGMDRLASLPTLFSPKSSVKNKQESSPPAMSSHDLEICRRLDEEYERALEEREIGYNARFNSVRQSAGFSIAFMAVYMTLGTIFFTKVAGWELHQALFFAIYTITTVGYGSYRLPDSTGFQIYTIFYIFVGIATLTIMVAQVYQCIALEASRAQHSRDKAELLQRSRDLISSNNSSRESSFHGSNAGDGIHRDMPDLHMHRRTLLEFIFHYVDECRRFLRDTEFGRGISILFPFASLIAIGAMVVGPIEGWTVVQSLYFAVVSLTTVGYGDFVPTKLASEYFCIFWLPFSVGFMSLFLGNIAAFYIRLSDKNIQRIERQMRRRMQLAKERAEKERAEVLRRALRGQEPEANESEDDDDEEQPLSAHGVGPDVRDRRGQVGFETLPSGDGQEDESVFAVDAVSERIGLGQQRRERVLSNSIYAEPGDESQASSASTMSTMRDILKTVRRNMAKGEFSYAYDGDPEQNEFMSIRSTSVITASSGGFRRQSLVERKPSFALRALVQERMARIIAIDVAGFQSNIDLSDNTLSITIASLPDIADKWLMPRRARKAFRTVAFEVLFFVGEHALITRGADALFDLTPFEFHGLFSPLLAAMGDADTMERWLASTDMLASVDLKREGILREGGADIITPRPLPREAHVPNQPVQGSTKGKAAKSGPTVNEGEIC